MYGTLMRCLTCQYSDSGIQRFRPFVDLCRTAGKYGPGALYAKLMYSPGRAVEGSLTSSKSLGWLNGSAIW